MKKIISLILVITLLSAFMVTASAEDVLLTAPADTATEEVVQEPAVDYSQYVNFVQGLKIMPEGEEFDGTANIKRGQFANYIYNILYVNNFDVTDTWYADLYAPSNYDQLIQPDLGVGYFDDVEKNHEYYQAISKLREIRIMNGTGERTFEPEEQITFEEASIVLVRVLGYEFYAKKYPYIPVASMLGVFKGLDYEADRKITHNELAKALYNCADIDITVAEYSSDAKTYKQLKGETIYSQFMDIHYAKGIVTGNAITSVYGTNGSGKNKVEIGGVEFDTAFAPYVQNMIGRNIDFFYRIHPETDAKQIVYASTTKRDDVVTIKASEFESFENNTITYYTGEDSTEEVELVANPKLIYNGKYKAPFDASIFEFVNGDITVIAPDGGDYTYIVINDYKSYYVTDVDTVAEKIYAKTYEEKVRNFDIRALKDYQVQYNLADGSELDLSTIPVGSIIDVLETDKNLKIIVSKDLLASFNVTGNYTDDTLYVSNGVEDVYYPVLPSFYKYAKDNSEKALVNGKTYNLYLNSFGQIAYAEISAVTTGQVRGLVIGAKASSRLGELGAISFVNENGVVNELQVAKNATLITETGEKVKLKSASEFTANIEMYLADNPYARVFKLNISEENVITKIEIPRLNDQDRKGEFGVIGKLNGNGYTQSRWGTRKLMFSNLIVTDQTLVFYINEAKTDDRDRYKILKRSEIGTFSAGASVDSKIVPYNSNSNSLVAECIVLISDMNTQVTGETLFTTNYMVEKVVNSKDEEGNPITKVTGYRISGDGNALKKETFTADAGIFENAKSFHQDVPARAVRKGDIITFTSYNSKVNDCYIVFSVYNDSGKVDLSLVGTKPIKGDESDIDLTTVSTTKLPSNPYWVQQTSTAVNYSAVTPNSYSGTSYCELLFGNAYNLDGGNFLVYTTQPIDLGVPFDITFSDTRYTTHTLPLTTKYIVVTLKGQSMSLKAGTKDDINTFVNTGINCSKVLVMQRYMDAAYMVFFNIVK